MPQWEYCALSFDEEHITYYLYQMEGIHTESDEVSSYLWGRCLAILGSIGWEAVAVHHEEKGASWSFKRMIHPNNHYLTLDR
jgi:hypothetical protein